jgi:hypothetical protein
VQLLVPEGEYERASQMLAEETDVGMEARLNREREEEERETAIREAGRGEAESTDIRAVGESPVQAEPTPRARPEPAAEEETEADAAGGLPDDQEEDERDERSVTWTADDIAARAFRAAIFGLLICPGLLHFYALWLVIRLPSAEGELSPAGWRKAIGAMALSLPVSAVSLIFLGWVLGALFR